MVPGHRLTDPAFDASPFAKNRERLLQHDVAGAFCDAVLDAARRRHLLSDEHFTVDGTLLESWASLTSFKRKDHPTPPGDDEPPATRGGRNPEVDFPDERRTNAPHASTTAPDARLARKGKGKGKGKEAQLCLMGHVLMENRHGLVVAVLVTHATGTAERAAAVRFWDRRPEPQRPGTLGADKNDDTRAFVADCQQRRVTPHVAQNPRGRRSAIDGRTTRHPGYAVSQRLRKRVEEVFGWTKTVGGGRKLR